MDRDGISACVYNFFSITTCIWTTEDFVRRIMRGFSMELFLFLFTLNSIIGMEDAHSMTGSDVPFSTDSNINDADAPVEYECVYVSPNLQKCLK